MACYSDDTKAKAAKFVTFVSIAVFLFGLITVAYAYAQSTGQNIEGDSEYTSFKVDKSGFATMTLIGGVFAIITAILGCLTAKFKKFFLAVPFGCIAFIIALLLLIAGTIAGGFDSTIQDLKDQACT